MSAPQIGSGGSSPSVYPFASVYTNVIHVVQKIVGWMQEIWFYLQGYRSRDEFAGFFSKNYSNLKLMFTVQEDQTPFCVVLTVIDGEKFVLRNFSSKDLGKQTSESFFNQALGDVKRARSVRLEVWGGVLFYKEVNDVSTLSATYYSKGYSWRPGLFGGVVRSSNEDDIDLTSDVAVNALLADLGMVIFQKCQEVGSEKDPQVPRFNSQFPRPEFFRILKFLGISIELDQNATDENLLEQLRSLICSSGEPRFPSILTLPVPSQK